MPRKTSLYIDEACAAIIAARDGSPSKVRSYGRASLLFRELLRRYDAITSRDLPELPEAEWAGLVEVGKGWATSDDISATTRMAQFFEAASYIPNDDTLLKKLLQFNTGQRMAVLDFVERYWAAKARGEAPPQIPTSSISAKKT